jgi:hypothetical protein
MPQESSFFEVNGSYAHDGPQGLLERGTMTINGNLSLTNMGGFSIMAGHVTRFVNEGTATVTADQLGTVELPQPSDPSQKVTFDSTFLMGSFSAERHIDALTCLRGNVANLAGGFENSGSIRARFDTCNDTEDGGLCALIGLPPAADCWIF